MSKHFSPEADDQMPEKKRSQNRLLLLLLLLAALFAYLYFFTGLIKPREEQSAQAPAPEAAPTDVVRQPLPPRPEAGGAQPGATAGEPAAEAKGGTAPAEPETAPAKPGAPAPAAAPEGAKAGKPAAAPEGAKAGKPATAAKGDQAGKPAAAPPAAKPAKPAAPQTAQKPAASEPKPAAKPAAAAKGTPAKPAAPAADAKQASGKPAAAKDAKTAAAAKTAQGGKKGAAADKGKAVAAKAAPAAAAGAYALEINDDLPEAELKPVAAKLKQAGIAPVVTTRSQKGEPVHRLYLADFGDRDEALEELQRLKGAAPNAFMLKENGRYTLYAGSFMREGRAAVEQDRLYEKGVKVLIRSGSATVPVVKLRAGNFSDQAKAEKAAQSLKQKGISAKVVKVAK